MIDGIEKKTKSNPAPGDADIKELAQSIFNEIKDHLNKVDSLDPLNTSYLNLLVSSFQGFFSFDFSPIILDLTQYQQNPQSVSTEPVWYDFIRAD